MFLALYIAIAVTVLGVLILESVGENAEQSKQIAQQGVRIARQARASAKKNQISAIKGCYRGNYVREKINVISGALTSLLQRSVAESEKITPLTPSQVKFLELEYRRLKPLRKVNCKKHYGDAPKPSSSPSP
jgi:heme exporter protein D